MKHDRTFDVRRSSRPGRVQLDDALWVDGMLEAERKVSGVSVGAGAGGYLGASFSVLLHTM